jgi:O-acetyl-ADP-ribose deacetylase (regulator of RNase III)
MLKHTKGNLIDLAEQGEFDVIVHGCNCLNTMGSGIAAEIRQRYPQAYAVDTKFSQNYTTEEKLGKFSLAFNTFEPEVHQFVIVNAYTQLNFMPRGVDHFEYGAFENILDTLLWLYGSSTTPVRFGFPYIGMGLAGGDKDRIIAMLEEFAEKVSAQGGSVTLVEFG